MKIDLSYVQIRLKK